ncbi:alkaline phosphatase family protein [Dyadobacter chenwenxiniae]|uniref:Alkaline phosphatase family protein n=1 Tax=Dyadobacter chenwenxiniae TaxID=2906456 RepID=A0A9X1PM30_9BACT|nr:alkaline phosphatase family protein [Dyadobacter chenwenxiniae]MCF0063812.1 alkaline phosphatase family protein [Dyadobacter chenwenxiniae]UON83488.1 alkaline phosphatase family protein [Dyadobacter chenwenxiniae]
MKKPFLPFIFIALGCMTLPLNVFAQNKTKKTLFVIVDGISADVIEKVSKPNLDAISKAGGYSRAHVGGEKSTYSQSPTISAVGYNCLLTGTWTNKHNVWDNYIKDPNYNYWTIFRFFEEQYPQKRSALFSTWLDNRTKLVGDGLPQTNKLRIDYPFDGFELDTIHFPHDKQSQYIHKIDEKVVDEAASYIASDAPDLSWVYLEFTDDMGHKYGDSEQFHNAIKMMDDQMGRLWKAIQVREKDFNEDWLIVITTDHGRDPKSGKDHGGQTDRERSTWIVTNAKDLNQNFKPATEADAPGIVDIMPTIARHMDISFPKEQAFEVDGVPFTGKLSVTNPTVKKGADKIDITWKSVNKEGKVKIWLTTTNHFKEGGRDIYHLIDEVPVTNEKLEMDISKYRSGFFKIVLEGKYNTVNRWIVP